MPMERAPGRYRARVPREAGEGAGAGVATTDPPTKSMAPKTSSTPSMALNSMATYEATDPEGTGDHLAD